VTAAERDGRVLTALGLAVVAVSSAAAVIKLARPLPPAVVACLRVSVTALGLVLIGRGATLRAAASLRSSPRDAGWTVLAGLCLAAHFGAWIVSLSLTSVVRSVALVSTQPLFAGLLARALGDRAPSRLYLGTLVAIAGTVSMIEPGESSGAWLGDLLALSAAITAALYLAIGRRVHARLGDALPLSGYLVCVNLIAAASLGLLALALGSEFVPEGVALEDYLAVVWLGLIPGVVGHGLLNWAVRRVPVHIVSLAILLEPAGAALIAWMLLGEGVGVREGVGAVVLLGGVALGLPRRRTQRDVDTDAS
jgi:drug/metabolite transporter (DMT)-like permease